MLYLVVLGYLRICFAFFGTLCVSKFPAASPWLTLKCYAIQETFFPFLSLPLCLFFEKRIGYIVTPNKIIYSGLTYTSCLQEQRDVDFLRVFAEVGESMLSVKNLSVLTDTSHLCFNIVLIFSH